MPGISAIVITYNEENNIERCLRSVQWANEIIVVDSFSTDRTVERARAFTPHVLAHEYDGEVKQREFGFSKATGDWLFWIDADEEVSDELKHEILAVVASPDDRDAYVVPRKAFAYGKWIEHGGWFPDWQLRLARKGRIVPVYQEIHGGFAPEGTTGRLKGLLLHYTYPSIEEHIRKMNDQTSLHVTNKLKEKPARKSLAKIVFSPLSHFFRQFVSNKGYKDGFQGFLLAVLGAIYTLSLYSKIWEYKMRQKESKGLLPPITNIELGRLRRP